MRVESMIQTKNVQSNKSAVESNPEEFNKALAGAITKDSQKTNSKGLRVDSEEMGEELEGEATDILAGLFAVSMLEIQGFNQVELDADIELKGELLLVDEANNNVPVDKLGIEDEIIALGQGFNSMESFNTLDSRDINEQQVSINKSFNLDIQQERNLNLPEGKVPSANDEEEMSLTVDNKFFARRMDPEMTNLSIDNTNREKNIEASIPTESDILNKPISADELKLSKEQENISKADINISEVNIQGNGFVKNLNFSIGEAEQSPKAILSNENLQNINESILHLAESTTEGQANVLKVKLFPDDLGTVDITLSMESGKLTAKILVDNDHVKGMFTNSINELNQSLAKENISVEKINIDLNLNSDFSNGASFNMNQQGSFRNSKRFTSSNHISLFNSSKEVDIKESSMNQNGAISILA